MTITTKSARVIIVKRTTPPPAFTNKWLCREGSLSPVYVNQLKGKTL